MAAARAPLWPLLLALAVTCTLGWWFKGHCMAGGWRDAIQYTSGCYSDAVVFWGGRGLDRGLLPYLQARMEYPVLSGAQIGLEGALTRALFGASANAGAFLAVVTAANALLAALVLVLLQRAGLERARLWCWAAAPPLVLYLGHNWDLGAVAFAVASMLSAWRGRLVLASALAALGVAAKLFPVLLLPILALCAWGRAGRSVHDRLADMATAALAAVGAWSLVNLPVAVLAPLNWSEF